MSNEIELYSKIADPIAAIDRMGEWFAKSGMFGCKNEEQGKVLALTCVTERKSPTEISRTYHIIDGKLSKKSMAALAEFRKRGGKFKWLNTGELAVANEDDREAIGEFSFDGQSVTARFSIRDARRAGFYRRDSAWEKTPAKMLRARVASNAIGMIAPEVYAGVEDESDCEVSDVPNLDLAQINPTIKSPESDPPKVGDAAEVQSISVQHCEPKMPDAQNDAKLKPKIVEADVSESGTLPEQTVVELEAAIGEHAIKAVAWMLKEHWIQPGQGLQHLKPTQATRILKQRDSFIRAIAT